MQTMTYPKYFLIILFAAFAFLAACDDGSPVSNEMDEATDEVAEEYRTESEEIGTELREARAAIDARLAVLERDLKDANAEAQDEIQENIRELKDYGNDVDDQIDKLGKDLKTGWKAFKQETKSTLEAVEAEVEKELND